MREDGGDEFSASQDDLEAAKRGVEEHVQEILVVEEAYAVGDPRAVMVHFEDADVALGTVVTSVRFCF